MTKYFSTVWVPALLASAALTTPAFAGSSDGKLQVKALVTGVLPDGKITQVVTDGIGLPANSNSSASDSIVSTVAVEYFLSPNLSIETICCITPHDVTGTGGIANSALIDDAIILPATVTAKYHFDLAGGAKPYVGAGPAYFFIFGDDVGADAAALGATRADLSDELGLAVQAGIVIPPNDKGLGLSIDGKRYFIGTTASFYDGDTLALRTEHDLDPWVVSAGLSYRF